MINWISVLEVVMLSLQGALLEAFGTSVVVAVEEKTDYVSAS